MSNPQTRLEAAAAEITPECSPLCRVASHEDTNHHRTEHALGCPVWHRICAERAAKRRASE